jgi:hypothetical protein
LERERGIGDKLYEKVGEVKDDIGYGVKRAGEKLG